MRPWSISFDAFSVTRPPPRSWLRSPSEPRDELHDLIDEILPDATVTRHQGSAHFDSLDAWVHTDVRGWTLADMITDDQYEQLLASAKTELAHVVDDGGRVRFAAPALIATAHVPGNETTRPTGDIT